MRELSTPKFILRNSKRDWGCFEDYLIQLRKLKVLEKVHFTDRASGIGNCVDGLGKG
jgi:hypothetical protein